MLEHSIPQRFKRTFVSSESQFKSAEDLWDDMISTKKAEELTNNDSFEKFTYQNTTTNQMEFSCFRRNYVSRGESFYAAFLEIKPPSKKEYIMIVGMNNEGQILWARESDWPKQFKPKDDSQEWLDSAKSMDENTRLVLFASRLDCELEQGIYRCSVAVKRRTSYVYRQTTLEWMTPNCTEKYSKQKVAWAAGVERSDDIGQFYYEYKRISGNMLTKSTDKQLLTVSSNIFTYKYKDKARTLRLQTCMPTLVVKQRLMQVYGIVFSIQRLNSVSYVPIVGVDDRGKILWSDSVSWTREYTCGENRQKCDMAFGSISTRDPHLIVYTDDCKRDRGMYKCDMFVQFAGSPLSEMVTSEALFNSTTCQNETKREIITQPLVVTRPPVSIAAQKFIISKTNIVFGSVFGGLLLAIIIYLVWKTRKNMKINREKEEEIILLHNEKAKGTTGDASIGDVKGNLQALRPKTSHREQFQMGSTNRNDSSVPLHLQILNKRNQMTNPAGPAGVNKGAPGVKKLESKSSHREQFRM